MAPTAPAVGNDYDTIMAATVVAGAPTPQPVAPTPAPSREDEGDWTDGPAGFCDGDEAELGETASREECIGACDEAGYEAMTWDTIGGACYCFMEDWCDCVLEYEYYAEDTEDWCWCGETDDGFDPEAMSESECAAGGCYYHPGGGCECGQKKKIARRSGVSGSASSLGRWLSRASRRRKCTTTTTTAPRALGWQSAETTGRWGTKTNAIRATA